MNFILSLKLLMYCNVIFTLQVENFLGCRDYDEKMLHDHGHSGHSGHSGHGGYKRAVTDNDNGRREMTKTSLQVVKQRRRVAACAENSV
jgi:hypothetical protein